MGYHTRGGQIRGRRPFQGAVLFGQKANTTYVNSPYLAGVVIPFYWRDVCPAPGVYNWSVVEQLIAPWVGSSQKIILRPHNSQNFNNGATGIIAAPDWLYGPQPVSATFPSGVPSGASVRYVTDLDTSIVPVRWDPNYAGAHAEFASALTAKYGTDSRIWAVQVDIGDNAETLVDGGGNPTSRLALWNPMGYTPALWQQTYKTLASHWTALAAQKPAIVMFDDTFIQTTPGVFDVNTCLNDLAGMGFWAENNGNWSGEVLSNNYALYPHLFMESIKSIHSGSLGANETLLSHLQNALCNGADYALVFKADVDDDAALGYPALTFAANMIGKVR